MVSKPKFVFSPADLVNEVAAIQGDRTWVSTTMINEAVEQYPELTRIITTNPEKSAKYVISNTLKAHNYIRWNSTTGSSVSAVWRSLYE